MCVCVGFMNNNLEYQRIHLQCRMNLTKHLPRIEQLPGSLKGTTLLFNPPTSTILMLFLFSSLPPPFLPFLCLSGWLVHLSCLLFFCNVRINVLIYSLLSFFFFFFFFFPAHMYHFFAWGQSMLVLTI